MKILIYFLSIYFSISSLHAQMISSISLDPIFEGNLITVDGFGKLNELLKKNNLYTIQNEFMSSGIELTFTNGKGNGGVELSYLRMNSYLYDSTNLTNKFSAPFISGTNLRLNFFKKFMISKRWYANVGIGSSLAYLNFKLVNRNNSNVGFDSLLSNPKLSPALDLSSRGSSIALHASSGIYYKTKLSKEGLMDFDIGMRLGYTHPLIHNRGWLVNGTRSNFINNFPTIYLNNIYFQVILLLKFNFPSHKTKA
jgi:hypothetical protein